MNSFIRFLLTTLLLVSCTRNKPDTNNLFNEKSIINEGFGVDDFLISSLYAPNVIATLGKEYKVIDHNHYSIELLYEQSGVSFYYSVNDPSMKIFSLTFNENFKGSTKRGFSISRMTVSDMLKTYGQPRWNLLESAHTIFAHYDSLGIYFAVKPKGVAPNEILTYSDDDTVALRKRNKYYDSVYHSDKIIEISIGEIGSDF